MRKGPLFCHIAEPMLLTMTTTLIAGGTSGIGLSISRALLENEANEVFLIGRNAEKGRAIEAALNADNPGRAEFIELDLSDIAAVKQFAARFLATHETLDLLAHIAGVMEPQRRITDEGFERTFAVGYLSAFVLETQLAPLLQKAPHGRIVNVAGVARFIFEAKLDFDDLSFAQNYGSFRAAITTVHAKTVLTEILSEEYASMGIDVNSFNPGAVRSDLMKNMSWWTRMLFKVPSLFMSETCKTGIRVCCAPELEGTSGRYFVDDKAIDLNFGPAYKERLRLETASLLAGDPGEAVASQ